MINIAEDVTTGIISMIQNGIGASLDALNADRPDGDVTLENPPEESYFTYESAIGYRAPAIFVVPTAVDFKLARGPNHVAATVSLFVSLIVEDRNQDLLQTKCFRYADAIYRTISRQTIETTQSKDVIKVLRMAFSGTEASKGKIESVFRKEATLLLDVEHYNLES